VGLGIKPRVPAVRAGHGGAETVFSGSMPRAAARSGPRPLGGPRPPIQRLPRSTSRLKQSGVEAVKADQRRLRGPGRRWRFADFVGYGRRDSPRGCAMLRGGAGATRRWGASRRGNIFSLRRDRDCVGAGNSAHPRAHVPIIRRGALRAVASFLKRKFEKRFPIRPGISQVFPILSAFSGGLRVEGGRLRGPARCCDQAGVSAAAISMSRQGKKQLEAGRKVAGGGPRPVEWGHRNRAVGPGAPSWPAAYRGSGWLRARRGEVEAGAVGQSGKRPVLAKAGRMGPEGLERGRGSRLWISAKALPIGFAVPAPAARELARVNRLSWCAILHGGGPRRGAAARRQSVTPRLRRIGSSHRSTAPASRSSPHRVARDLGTGPAR